MANLRADGEKIDFLGFSVEYAHDQQGVMGKKYLCTEPSKRALQGIREKARETLSPKQCFTALPELIERLNRQLSGWANFFDYGYPRKAFGDLNSYVRMKRTRHLQRRIQRAWRPTGSKAPMANLNRMGLIKL